MSLSWANKFAKSALLSAQKHIDSVLDIKDNLEDESTDSGEKETENSFIEENVRYYFI